ncbi:MAG: hypothetical protein WCL11_24710, partial [Verrucomicrobiota bacterium]
SRLRSRDRRSRQPADPEVCPTCVERGAEDGQHAKPQMAIPASQLPSADVRNCVLGLAGK